MKHIVKLLEAYLKKRGYVVPNIPSKQFPAEYFFEGIFLGITIAYYIITIICLCDSNMNIWGMLGWFFSMFIVVFEDILSAVHGYFSVKRANHNSSGEKYIFLIQIYLLPLIVNVPIALFSAIMHLWLGIRWLMIISTGFVAIRGLVKWIANMLDTKDYTLKTEELLIDEDR